MEEDIFRKILKDYWGYDDFRGIQRQIVESISSGRDTLGLMPTGGGKSICFQVPALAKGGLTIVVTPLISLMKDQVQQLKMRGIRAEAIYSGIMHDDIVRILDNCIFGAYTFIYMSPERLSRAQRRLPQAYQLRHPVCHINKILPQPHAPILLR